MDAYPGAPQNLQRRVMDDLTLLAIKQREVGDCDGVGRHSWYLRDDIFGDL
jgi:hypothetical protein